MNGLARVMKGIGGHLALAAASPYAQQVFAALLYEAQEREEIHDTGSLPQ